MRADLSGGGHLIVLAWCCGLRIAAGTVLLSLLVGPRPASGATGPHSTVDLVAEQSAVFAAQPFWLGLQFRLDPGWHIYWVNPGDSGQPPRIKWSLPAGFSPGPLLWPTPQRIEDHSLIDYGYLDEVLLPVEVTPPANLSAGTEIQISGTVNWLICRDECQPAHAPLSLSLPVRKDAEEAPASAHALFARARAELPSPAPKTWKVAASLKSNHFVLTVDTGITEKKAAFFPLAANQIENAAGQKVNPTAHGVQLELVKSDQLLKPPARLVGVLRLGTRQGYVIDAPIQTSK